MLRASTVMPAVAIAGLGATVTLPLAREAASSGTASAILCAVLALVLYVKVPVGLLLLRRFLPGVGRLLGAGVAVASLAALSAITLSERVHADLAAFLTLMGPAKSVAAAVGLGFVVFAALMPFVEASELGRERR